MPKPSTGSIRMRSLNKKPIAQGMLLLIAVLLIICGLMDGGFKDVKNKAVMICYECIGIG